MSLITDLRNQIAAAEKRIAVLQEACPHPEVAIIVRSWGVNCDDERFSHCTCGLCEAEFTRPAPATQRDKDK